MKNRPKILFLDWNGTLSSSEFWGHMQFSTQNEKDIFSQIEDYLFKRNGHLIGPWMRAENTSEVICEIISKETNIKFNKVFNEFIKSCQQMKFDNKSIPELIKKIRKTNTKVYIATDNMDSFTRWTVPALRLNSLFDGIINSYEIKALKRDFGSDGTSLFFDRVFKDEGVTPNDSILIDDSEDKNNLLSNYGINYIRINNDNTLESNLSKLL